MTDEAAAEMIRSIQRHLGRALADQAIANTVIKEKYRLKYSELLHENKTLLKRKKKFVGENAPSTEGY